MSSNKIDISDFNEYWEKHKEHFDKYVEELKKRRPFAYEKAMKDFPDCHCYHCGYEWTSRKEKVLPATCPQCKKNNWFINYKMPDFPYTHKKLGL